MYFVFLGLQSMANRIRGVMVRACSPPVGYTALRRKSKAGWLRIRLMCPSGATCLLRTVVSVNKHYKNPKKKKDRGTNNDLQKIRIKLEIEPQ